MGDRPSFTSYTRDKQSVAEVLRDTQRYFEQRQRGIAGEMIRALLVRLAEDRFNLVVVGQFKRGKSSLINAILGRDVLPTSIIPLTSIITALRYGDEDRLLVRREGSGSPLQLPVSKLAEYVTERGNPNNEKRVLSVEVEVSSPFLRRGLYVVDTPGIGSANQANTATSYSFLPEADAVIFVTSVEAPLSEAELGFVDTIRKYAERVFFVLNKIDQASESERSEAIAYTEQLLRERLGATSLRLFTVSAKQALDGKTTGVRRVVDESGLASLEEALAAFLAAEKEVTLLRSILDRALRLLREEQQLLEQRHSGDDSTPDVPETSFVALGPYLDDLVASRDRIVNNLYTRVRTFLDDVVAKELVAFSASEARHLSETLESRIDQASRSEVSIVFQEVRAWIWDELSNRGRAWLASRSTDWEATAGELLQQARRDLAVRSNEQNGKLDLSARLVAILAENPPPFVVDLDHLRLSDGRTVEDSPLFYLPRPIASRAARRRLLEALDPDAAMLAQRMQDEIARFLEGVVDRIQRDTERALQDLRQLTRSAPSMLQETSETSSRRTAQSDERIPPSQQVTALIDRILALRHALGERTDSDQSTIPVDGVVTTTQSNQLEVIPKTPERTLPIETALRKPTCPVCLVVRDAVWEFLCHWQYALPTDEATRRVFRADGGLCAQHTWALEAVASPRGLCGGYPVVLDRFVEELEGLVGVDAPAAAARLNAIIPNAATCRLCIFQRQREAAALHDLAAFLDTQDGRSAYRRSRGLCLPHLQALLATGVSADAASLVIEEAVRRLGETAGDMRGYALKLDARRRDLVTRGEGASSITALTLLAGDQQALRRRE